MELCGLVPTKPASQAWTSVLAWYTGHPVVVSGTSWCPTAGEFRYRDTGSWDTPVLAPILLQISQPVNVMLALHLHVGVSSWELLG